MPMTRSRERVAGIALVVVAACAPAVPATTDGAATPSVAQGAP
jgi:hypothetical protein